MTRPDQTRGLGIFWRSSNVYVVVESVGSLFFIDFVLIFIDFLLKINRKSMEIKEKSMKINTKSMKNNENPTKNILKKF